MATLGCRAYPMRSLRQIGLYVAKGRARTWLLNAYQRHMQLVSSLLILLTAQPCLGLYMALAGTDKKPLDTMATSPINAVEQPKLDQTSLVLELLFKCCGGIQSLLVDNRQKYWRQSSDCSFASWKVRLLDNEQSPLNPNILSRKRVSPKLTSLSKEHTSLLN